MPSMPAVPVAAPSSQAVRAGVRGTSIAFVGSGFAFASWASRIPQVRDHLHLSPAQLGLVLLSIAAGSLLALPLSGPVVHRLRHQPDRGGNGDPARGRHGYRRPRLPGGTRSPVVGLFLLGLANGAWDVAMNVQGALVERHLGRSVMSRFHAGYSLGTVIGALAGAAMVALRVPVTAHLLTVAIAIGLAVPWGAGSFVDDAAGMSEHQDRTGRRSALAAWREPRTLLIGVFVLAFAFAEGTGNDWASIAMIDGYGTPAAVGTLAFAVFLSAMTVGRWFGPGLLDRHGRVPLSGCSPVSGSPARCCSSSPPRRRWRSPVPSSGGSACRSGFPSA